jgi:hypothetical protein
MGQVTIYLKPETVERMRTAAESEGLSQSRWVARLIERRLATSWPEDVARLAGSWPDAPTAEELRGGYGRDAERESF